MLRSTGDARARRDTPAATDQRLRVLLVGQGPPMRGGIPSFVQALRDDARLTAEVDYRFVNTSRPAVKRPGAPTVSNLALTARDAWEVARLARSADVVHLNLAPAPTLPMARALVLTLAAKNARRPVILHAHSGRIHAFARRPVYRLLLAATLRAVDAFAVVSRVEAAALPRRPAKVLTLENGIDVSDVPIGPKDEDPPILTFVGTVCERKGLIDLRDALKLLVERGFAGPRSVRVTIVGDATQEGPGVFERIRARYREVGFDRIEFTGALEPASVRERLAASAVFCLPSHWEGSPLSVLEAMAAGCAVVATSVGEIPSILGGGAGIVVPPRDPVALADALERVLRDERLRRTLGAAARRRAQERFDRRRLSERILALYRTAADGSGGRHSM